MALCLLHAVVHCSIHRRCAYYTQLYTAVSTDVVLITRSCTLQYPQT